MALVVGLLAAVYPALVLSSFRPAMVLKGGVAQASGSPIARSSLVVVQFAILVGLIVTTTTVYRQTQFALGRGLGDVDSKLIVGIITPCNNAFPDEVRKLPGVAAAACSSLNGAEHAQHQEHRPCPGRRRPAGELRRGAGRFRLLRNSTAFTPSPAGCSRASTARTASWPIRRARPCRR